MIIDTGRVYVAPVGDKNLKNWVPLGEIHAFKVIESPDDSEQDKRWQQTLSTTRQLTGFSTSVTFRLKGTPMLEYRSMLRLFGFQPPSLIHNGKKRRK